MTEDKEQGSGVRAIERAAEISPCGRYRYWLTRRWDFGAQSLPIIMLNPSTADAANDDPTIRRCMTFARREGFGGIHVMNLFAYRATSPADMKAADDPVGDGNDLFLDEMFDVAGSYRLPVLAAWGAHGGFTGRAEHVCAAARFRGASLVCLGTTIAGHPRHPLYVKADQPFVPFAQGGEARRGGDSAASSVHEHPVPQGCAQNPEAQT